ncbi:MAG TPA: hypothetical protein PLX06_09670 [Fimbriimonadaceae bacterium]|nr:hypothetical protein [Fimbriimonadaceae bacterium]
MLEKIRDLSRNRLAAIDREMKLRKGVLMKSRKQTSISPLNHRNRFCGVATDRLGKIAVPKVTTCVTMYPMESDSSAHRLRPSTEEGTDVKESCLEAVDGTNPEPTVTMVNAFDALDQSLKDAKQDTTHFLESLVDNCDNTPVGHFGDAVSYFTIWLKGHCFNPADHSPVEYARLNINRRMIDFYRQLQGGGAAMQMPVNPETGEEIEFPSRDARLAVIPWWERFKEGYRALTPVEAAGVHFGQEIYDSELEEQLRSATPSYYVPATPAGKGEVDYNLGERGERHVFPTRDSANRAYLRGREQLVEILGTDFIEGMDR